MISTSRLLFFIWLLAFPVSLFANEYYVSPQGSNNNPGTKEQPWQTIQYAVDKTAPGDIVFVEDGIYRESVVMTRSGSPGAYITLKAINKWGAKVEVPNGDGKVDGIKAAANYLTIDGFEIYDPATDFGHTGNGITVYDNHHVNVLNNKIHGFGGSGVQCGHFDHVLVENNVVYNNAKYNPNQSSGISMFQARAVDNEPGYHVIVRNNRSFGNINIVLSGNPIGTTDGNGILIDDFQNAYDDAHGPFPHRTLVENNLSYDNGGKGVQVFQSDYVDVFNNTAYHNNHDEQNTGTWRAELSLIYSHHTVWRNNIGVANPGAGEILQWNRAILIAESDNTVWENNLTYSGSPGDQSINLTNTPVTEADLANNLLGVNPQFNNEFGQDFSLKLESPAVNAGSDQIISFHDINYQPRPSGSVDIGAFEFDDNNLPVELTSFEAVVAGTDVHLSWTTASELNNAGFAIELSAQGRDFEQVQFVEGAGTTTTSQTYEVTLPGIAAGTYTFRLKQIDFDGTFAYSETQEVVITSSVYHLAQSYPNPFNPQTRIQYTLPVSNHVHLEVFDLMGRKIQTLVDQVQPAGTHAVLFEAHDLPNGTYVYRLNAGSFSETKTMVLVK